jgi:hypothetical protein
MQKIEPGQTHLVFGKSYGNSFLKNQHLAPLIGEVLTLNDNLGIGPISSLDTREGRDRRIQWLKQHIESDPHHQPLAGYVQQDYEVLEKLKILLNQGRKLYLWLNTKLDERLAAAWIFYNLQQPSPGLFMLDLPSEFRMKNMKGNDYFPETIRVVQLERIHLLAEHFREVSSKWFERYRYYWQDAENEHLYLRVWEEDRIRPVAVDHFDKSLLQHCKREFQKAARVVGSALVSTGFQVTDHFLNWRLHELVRMRLLEKEGNLGPMRDYQVRLNLG